MLARTFLNSTPLRCKSALRPWATPLRLPMASHRRSNFACLADMRACRLGFAALSAPRSRSDPCADSCKAQLRKTKRIPEIGYPFCLANNPNFDTILYCVFSISAIYRIIFLLSPLSYSLTIYLIFKY